MKHLNASYPLFTDGINFWRKTWVKNFHIFHFLASVIELQRHSSRGGRSHLYGVKVPAYPAIPRNKFFLRRTALLARPCPPIHQAGYDSVWYRDLMVSHWGCFCNRSILRRIWGFAYATYIHSCYNLSYHTCENRISKGSILYITSALAKMKNEKLIMKITPSGNERSVQNWDFLLAGGMKKSNIFLRGCWTVYEYYSQYPHIYLVTNQFFR